MSLRDLQSCSTVFLMKIMLTKEMKDSFKLFDDIFQCCRLAGAMQDERKNDEKILDKYEWDHLNDLMPLDITTTSDMAADWEISGVGGWWRCKENENVLYSLPMLK
jgi:hypothetical protein